jgi:glycerol-3-phosphate dehydrogenase
MRQAPTTQYLLQYYAAQMQPCYRSSCRPHVLSTSKVSPCKPSHVILDGTHGVRTRCFIRHRKQKNPVSAILYVVEGHCQFIYGTPDERITRRQHTIETPQLLILVHSLNNGRYKPSVCNHSCRLRQNPQTKGTG